MIAAVLLGVATYFQKIHDQDIIIYILTLFSYISAIYLVWSIYRIRKLIKEKNIEINTKIVIVHALTISIFLLSLFAFASTFYLHGFVFYGTNLLEAFCDCLTQMMICYIFWNMENIKFVTVKITKQTVDEEVAPEDAIKPELVQTTDSKSAQQLVIWQHFMRIPNSSVLPSVETSASTAIESQEDTTIFT